MMDWTALGQRGGGIAAVPTIIITGKGRDERAVAAIEAGRFCTSKATKGTVLARCWTGHWAKREMRATVVLQRQWRETGRLAICWRYQSPCGRDENCGDGGAELGFSVITGETVSRKRIVAQRWPKLSPRSGWPFVAINVRHSKSR